MPSAMSALLLRATIVCAAVLFLSVTTTVAPAGAATPPTLFGFNDHSTTSGRLGFEAAADVATAAGATATGMTLWWEYVEYEPGVYSWGMFDGAYGKAVDRGQTPLITISSSPLWAQEPGLPCDRGNCSYPPAAEHEDSYSEFVRQVAIRYPKAAIEIWNEPNMTWFFGGGPDPARYTRLLKLAYASVKSVNPAMPVVAGAFAPFLYYSTDRNMSVRDFLQGMYDAGARDHMDAISIHAYPYDMDFSVSYKAIAHVKETRDANDDDVPLWISEYGIPTTGEGAVTESQQALLLPALTKAFHADPEIRATLIHNLSEPRSTRQDWGVAKADLSPKPAYCALAAMNRTRYDCPPNVLKASAPPFRQHYWDAQMLLGAASDAALKIHKAEGRYAGVTPAKLNAIDPRISKLPAVTNALPGATADPRRIGVFQTTDGADGLLLCNVSKGDRSYCVITHWRGRWNYGMQVGGLNATAGATANYKVSSW